MDHPIARVDTHFQSLEPLTEKEIDEFISELDVDKDGNVSFSELAKRLKAVLDELAPEPQAHDLHHPSRWRPGANDHDYARYDLERGRASPDNEIDDVERFLSRLMSRSSEPKPKDEFKELVRSWNVPSQRQNSAEDGDKRAEDYKRKLSMWRWIRANWSLRGPRIIFACFVGAMILGFGLWQLMKYLKEKEVRKAFGWGVIMAKFFAGTLFPTMFFMLLSMSRWLGTTCRRFYHLSRFIDWDRHQSFHIWMACIGLFSATMHSIGHLTGTFLNGSQHEHEEAVEHLLGDDAPETYVDFLLLLPGWTGIVSLVLFWTIALLAMPRIRKWSYELFQAGHLLMFPMIGFLSAHGTARLLQYPMLGFWLAPPATLVILERLHRIYRGFVRITSTVELVDKETVSITCYKADGKPWRYSAGQYIFLQVPAISWLQWHPFTVSHCVDDVLQLHIKTDGNWTKQLRDLPPTIEVGIDGPFGAPAQRFYEYDRSLIVGAGVGVTPFSAIISDLEHSIFEEDGWSRRRSRRISRSRTPSRDPSRKSSFVSQSRASTLVPSNVSSRATSQTRSPSLTPYLTDSFLPSDTKYSSRSPSLSPYVTDRFLANDPKESYGGFKIPCSKRVDFHWMVREKNSLLWFSDLLNRAHDLSHSLPPGQLDLNIHTHITLKRTNISEHIFRCLLDMYRTDQHPVSALTGLKMRSHFGRPDFEKILHAFHDDVWQEVEQGVTKKGQKIAVFFCGAPAIGAVLSDLCYELTLKGKMDGSGSRWDFRMEVFG